MHCSSRSLTFHVLFFLLIAFPFVLHAQETDVHFKIINTKSEAVPYATVTVMSVPDTTHQQEQVSDSMGLAVFHLVQGHPYKIKISSVNYQALEKT